MFRCLEGIGGGDDLWFISSCDLVVPGGILNLTVGFEVSLSILLFTSRLISHGFSGDVMALDKKESI